MRTNDILYNIGWIMFGIILLSWAISCIIQGYGKAKANYERKRNEKRHL
jgi:hypothetical protein